MESPFGIPKEGNHKNNHHGLNKIEKARIQGCFQRILHKEKLRIALMNALKDKSQNMKKSGC